SSVALSALREAVSVPVLGVIGPGAARAAAVSPGGAIGVIGQPGTIASGRYESHILRARHDARVYSRATPLLVPLAEEGWMGTEVARLVLREYLAPLMAKGIDTLVLGCTHYPLFKDQIRTLFREESGGEVILVDSAEAIAGSLADMLRQGDLAATPGRGGGIQCFVTDAPQTFERVGRMFWGGDFPAVGQVDL
ncbi:MAG: aspartate/glutamate racemase family protein, partial [Deltaproteobacteria bacterium]|nr:aspartate/glutamate racemase family protein [Deltaproteobacteria bacterium]